ncbi:putative potassium transporter 17 [Quercus suber]|uniref:Potassium transporter 17 n=1 Tax=Quercus suber TaxID=58331 RepID=A0AAW0L1B0_QUESU
MGSLSQFSFMILFRQKDPKNAHSSEAMFADLGHFNQCSIQIAFLFTIYPSLVLTYAGQTAYLIKNPNDHDDGFYKFIPTAVYWPIFIIATLAAIVASQSVISATFSVIKQSVALDYFPRVKVVHTSNCKECKVYSPEVNYILMILCVAVILIFGGGKDIGDVNLNQVPISTAIKNESQPNLSEVNVVVVADSTASDGRLLHLHDSASLPNANEQQSQSESRPNLSEVNIVVVADSTASNGRPLDLHALSTDSASLPNANEQISRWSTLVLAYKTLGVVFGGLVTSPLYVYPSMPLKSPTKEDYLGIYSIMFWTLTLIGALKYASIAIKADDQGEVLSAMDGLRAPFPCLTLVEALSAVVLVDLFLLQKFGTSRVSFLFSPIIAAWTLNTPLVGIYSIIHHYPSIFKAISPHYIFHFFRRNGKEGWLLLGSTFLCITGSEAMFADLGHFNRRSIQSKLEYELTHKITLERLRELLSNLGVQRVPGLCFFYTNIQDGLTPVLGHYIKNMKSLHEVSIFTTLRYLPVPEVAPHERIVIKKLGLNGVYGCVIQYGYADSLNLEGDDFVSQVTKCLPMNLQGCSDGLTYDPVEIQEVVSDLEQAKLAGVVHVRGKTRFHKNCGWFDRIMLAFYEVMHNNCRSALHALGVPLQQRIEVGMLYEA